MKTLFATLTHNTDDVEPQFQAHYLFSHARQIRIAIYIWLIPSLLFGYSDYMIFGLSPQFITLLCLRLSFCVLSLYTIHCLSRIDSTHECDTIFLRWSAFATAFILYCNYSWSPFVPPNGALTVLIIFSTYLVFPNRLYIKLIPILTLSIGNLFLQWWVGQASKPEYYLTMTVAIVMANALGIVFSSLLQKHRRIEFKLRLDETRMREELSRLAMIDELTGVFNRRKLFQLGNEQFDRFKSKQESFSVLMIDIDHFKILNDNYGHETGDQVLSNFSAFVIKHLHEKNIWGRLGGEEFVLILPKIPGGQAALIAERLRLGLGKKPLSPKIVALGVTISIGVTEVRANDRSFEEVLNRADKALYKAKRNGRNKTELL